MKNRKKLNAYLATGAALMGAGSLEAQVIYTDIDPDEVLNLGTFISTNLDINQDGTDDFRVNGYLSSSSFTSTTFWTTFWSTSYGGGYTYTYTYTNTYFFRYARWSLESLHSDAEYVYDFNGVKGFIQNDQIDSLENFNSSSDYLFTSSYSNYGSFASGAWQNNAQGLFAGVRLTLNGQAHYGWIRISMNNYDQFVIHDMAISDVPLVPIAAGDTVVSNPSASLRDFEKPMSKIWNTAEGLIVSTDAAFGRYVLSVVDMSGKSIDRIQLTPGDKHLIQTSSWNKGVYVIFLKSEFGRLERRKIIIR